MSRSYSFVRVLLSSHCARLLFLILHTTLTVPSVSATNIRTESAGRKELSKMIAVNYNQSVGALSPQVWYDHHRMISSHQMHDKLLLHPAVAAFETSDSQKLQQTVEDIKREHQRKKRGVNYEFQNGWDSGVRKVLLLMLTAVAGFVCVSVIVLSLCTFCDRCWSYDEKSSLNGYIGRIDPGDIKVIFNPSAAGALNLPVYAHGGSGSTTSSAADLGFSNRAFTQSQESLTVLGKNNAAAGLPQSNNRTGGGGPPMSSDYRNRTRENRSTHIDTGSVATAPSVLRVERLVDGPVSGASRTKGVSGPPQPYSQSHISSRDFQQQQRQQPQQQQQQGKDRYSESDRNRKPAGRPHGSSDNSNNSSSREVVTSQDIVVINTRSQLGGSSRPGVGDGVREGGAATMNSTSGGGRLKDVQVDGTNRIVLTYENEIAVGGRDVGGARQMSGAGRNEARRGDLAREGRGLDYDMNDVAIKNLYARY